MLTPLPGTSVPGTPHPMTTNTPKIRNVKRKKSAMEKAVTQKQHHNHNGLQGQDEEIALCKTLMQS